MMDFLPQWLVTSFGCVAILALPLIIGAMALSTMRSVKGIARGAAGGPSAACVELGLITIERGGLSGRARGHHSGHPVEVFWAVQHQHGYDEKNQFTRASAAVTPPLVVGLEAVEGGPSTRGIGWPELERYFGVEARDPEGARLALEAAGAELWSAIGGPGRVLLDDSVVTVELPGVDADRRALSSALERAVTVAKALSRPTGY